MKTLTLEPISRVEGSVNLPGSKSVSNRALLLAALAKGTTRLTNLLDSDDILWIGYHALGKDTWYWFNHCAECKGREDTTEVSGAAQARVYRQSLVRDELAKIPI